MPDIEPTSAAGVLTQARQPLIAIPLTEEGRERVAYFSSEEEAESLTRRLMAEHPLSTIIGAWSDLDWERASDALEQIRRESVPTPPIDEL